MCRQPRSVEANHLGLWRHRALHYPVHAKRVSEISGDRGSNYEATITPYECPRGATYFYFIRIIKQRFQTCKIRHNPTYYHTIRKYRMELTDCSKTKKELIEDYNNLNPCLRKMLDNSYSTVIDTHASQDRLSELKEFCKKMDYQKIGIAFCKGLRPYGTKIDEELSKEFETYSVCCNVCGINKSDIKVQQMNPQAEEPACNPLGQATALNDKNVDIVVKCGFCLGHDILFSKKIKAPCTTIIVKDRKFIHKTAHLFEK